MQTVGEGGGGRSMFFARMQAFSFKQLFEICILLYSQIETLMYEML